MHHLRERSSSRDLRLRACSFCSTCQDGKSEYGSTSTLASTSTSKLASTSASKPSKVVIIPSRKCNGKVRGATIKISQTVNLVPLPEIPGPLAKLKCSTLRIIILTMLRSSTGQEKIYFGVAKKMPEWWPDDILPWRGITTDNRSLKQKTMMSWPNALRHTIKCCYIFFDRVDLLQQREPANQNVQSRKKSPVTPFEYGVKEVLVHLYAKACFNAVGQVEINPNEIVLQVPPAILDKIETVQITGLGKEFVIPDVEAEGKSPKNIYYTLKIKGYGRHSTLEFKAKIQKNPKKNVFTLNYFKI